tara:strand:+ start:170 stop:508 length:339 start_codon:yes stop_codon:yes gene_type:complete
MYSVTLPFIGKDITKSKVEEVMVKLCFGSGITIEIYENYDSKKEFRSAIVHFNEIFKHSKTKLICKQLGEGGEVVIRMHKKKVSRWIMRADNVGSIFGVRPKKNQQRIYVNI